MTVHGYEIIGKWETSNCGYIAVAKRGGKKYFLKKYQTPVAPINNGTLDAKTFENNKKQFEAFYARRKKVNGTIRLISGSGGNIVIPVEEFMDENHYVEASEFVEGAIPDDEAMALLPTLDMPTKLLLMKTAAGALSSIHSKHIIHCDLKIKNLMLARNVRGNYVAKMLDFDSSYPVDDIPDVLTSTIEYFSPEYGCIDDDNREELNKTVTEKHDIFAMGLIFHFYLTGAFPEAVSLTEKLQKRKEKGKTIYPWVALNHGCQLQISPKITDLKLLSLIADMLDVDPEKRPTASEVLKRLQAPSPSATGLVLPEPFSGHGIVFDKEKLKADRVALLEKVETGAEKKYQLLYHTGSKKTMTKEDLLAAGYAKAAVPEGFEAPWEEDHIALDLEKIKSRGFVSSKTIVKSGVKGYEFYRANGSATFLRLDTLLAMKYAKKLGGAEGAAEPSAEKAKTAAKPSVKEEKSAEKPASEGAGDAAVPPSEAVMSFDEPWPEHGIELDLDMIKAKGYVALARKTMAGVNGYECIGSGGVKRFIRAEMLLMQKLAKKK